MAPVSFEVPITDSLPPRQSVGIGCWVLGLSPFFLGGVLGLLRGPRVGAGGGVLVGLGAGLLLWLQLDGSIGAFYVPVVSGLGAPLAGLAGGWVARVMKARRAPGGVAVQPFGQ